MILDNLKDVWKNQSENTIVFSETDIYKMIHKKSASIVKWIFYISILEFAIFSIVPLLFNDNNEMENKLYIEDFLQYLTYISYAIAILFIFLFYKNYKQISVTDSAKKLMNNIVKTRNTVKNYIFTQLGLGAIALFALLYKIIKSPDILSKFPKEFTKFYLVLMFLIIGLFVLGLVWLFYKLIYGFLLKRLKENYNELQKKE